MNKKIEKVLSGYEVNNIETALVQLFIENNKITVNKNALIKNYINNTNAQILSAKRELEGKINIGNIYDFVNIYELLVPSTDKKINGAFFTPENITRYIANQTIQSANQTICDPSCGCGAFLITAASLISKKFNKKIIDIIENNLYGVDITKYSIHRTKILLSLLALKNNEDKNNINFNLSTADSLVVNWKELFPGIINNGGFNVVLGNPPYVKFQDLNKSLREKLYCDWQTLKTGNYNLYFAFFELGINLIKNDGILGYITPNNYFTSLAGIQLREYLASNKLIDRIIDFNHLKIFEAQTYTCITLLNKAKKDFFYYERVEEYERLELLDKIKYSKIYYSRLNNKKWRLLREGDQLNIKKIEDAGKKLGDLVDIRVGIATCKDTVYFIDGSTLQNGYYRKTYQGNEFLIEKDITLPIAKISDYKNQDDLNNNIKRIIFPYNRTNGKAEIIPEKELKLTCPLCYKYFLAAKEELSTRDKGQMKYPEWYAYARTQGMNFFGEKLLTPTFSSEPRFLLEKNKNSLFCNGYAIYLRTKSDLFSQAGQTLDLTILQKILNSRIMDYYVKQTSVSIEGGFPCYQKNFIELFGIPTFSSSELGFLKKEQDKTKINNFLIKKYEITI